MMKTVTKKRNWNPKQMKKNNSLNYLPGGISKMIQLVIVTGIIIFQFSYSGFGNTRITEIMLANNGQAMLQ